MKNPKWSQHRTLLAIDIRNARLRTTVTEAVAVEPVLARTFAAIWADPDALKLAIATFSKECRPTAGSWAAKIPAICYASINTPPAMRSSLVMCTVMITGVPVSLAKK